MLKKRFLLVGLVVCGSLGCGQDCLNQPMALEVLINADRDHLVGNWEALDRLTAGTPIQVQGNLARDGQQHVLLPIDMAADYTRYALQIDGKPDTLLVRYDKQVQFVSPKCGYGIWLKRPSQRAPATRVRGRVDTVYYLGDPALEAISVYSSQRAILVKLSL